MAVATWQDKKQGSAGDEGECVYWPTSKNRKGWYPQPVHHLPLSSYPSLNKSREPENHKLSPPIFFLSLSFLFFEKPLAVFWNLVSAAQNLSEKRPTYRQPKAHYGWVKCTEVIVSRHLPSPYLLSSPTSSLRALVPLLRSYPKSRSSLLLRSHLTYGDEPGHRRP
jgi:hypothetical protein